MISDCFVIRRRVPLRPQALIYLQRNLLWVPKPVDTHGMNDDGDKTPNDNGDSTHKQTINDVKGVCQQR